MTYQPSTPFADMADLIRWLDDGGWVWWPSGKPLSPKWVENMSLACLRGHVRLGLRRAVRQGA